MRRGFAAASLTLVGCLAVPGAGDDDGGPGSTSDATSGTSLSGTSTGGSTGPTSSTTTPGTSGSSSTTLGDPTSGGTETSGADPCMGDESDNNCPDDALPYCVDGECVACADLPMACEGLDTTAPVCDDASGSCTACTEHDQCASGACRMSTGACFGMVNRLWVDASADCDAASGSEQTPFCTIQEAVTTVSAQPGNEPWAVFVAGAASVYTLPQNLNLPARPFALVGAAEGLATRITGGTTNTLAMSGNTDFYLAHLVVEAGSDATRGVLCNFGALWADDVEIHEGQTGLYLGNCDARMRRVRVTDAYMLAVDVRQGGTLMFEDGTVDNSYGGIETSGSTTFDRTVIANNYLEGGIKVLAGDLTVNNSMFAYNVYTIGAIDVAAAASASLNYVSIVFDAVSCSSPDATLTIRNSIVSDISGCEAGQATITQSLVDEAAVGFGSGNLEFVYADINQVFVDPNGVDLHIGPNPPGYIEGVAIRSDTDPATDFDGDPRPAVGQPDYPGADAAP